MKTLALIVRKPGLSRENFRAHYEELHAPLALPLMSGLLRYVRQHVHEELHGAAGFDVMTSFTYRDVAAMQQVIARLAGPAGDAILRDELTFMDKPRNRFFEVREASETGARAADAPFTCIVFVKHASGRGAGDLAAEFANRALPALRDSVPGLRWCLHQAALGSFGEPPWDAVTQLHADAVGDLLAWCLEREREGARALLVRVSEHASAISPGGVA